MDHTLPGYCTALSTRQVNMVFKTLVRLMALVAILVPVVAVAAPAHSDPIVEQELAAVRRATAKYHDVEKALAQGYVATPRCASAPGLGGMGYHYIKPSLATDLALDPVDTVLFVKSPKSLEHHRHERRA